MATKTADGNFTGIFDQAMEAYGETFKASVKMQEDVSKWWTEALEQPGPVQEWQRRARGVLNDAIPAVQRNTEEWLRVVETNNARSTDLLKKAFSGNSAANPAELQARLQELWEQSLGVLKDNTQAMAQVNVKMMELWAELLKKNMSAAVKSAAAATAKA